MRIAARFRGPIAFWALAGLALLVSHDAVFLAQLGPGQGLTAALRTAGHDYWGAASLLLLLIAGLTGAATLLRLSHLRRQAAALAAVHQPDRRERRVLRTWARLAAVVVVGFALQENAEHFITHGHLIGTGALLGPEYPLALPVLGIVSLGAALGAAVLVASERELVAAIVAALARRLRPTRTTMRPPQRIPAPTASVLARFTAGRAPPVLQLPLGS